MDVKEALEKAEEAKTYWGETYRKGKEDVRFSIGLDHYTDAERTRLGEDNCMISPVIPQYIHQVVNGIRENTPSATVIPGDAEGSNHETAEVFKGLIRSIEYKSKADAVYDAGAEYAVRGGLGFARVDHDYVSDDSFLQELKLRRVQNPFSIYLDPSYVECDGSDAEWGFALDRIKKDVFEEKYPGKACVSFDSTPTDSKAEEIQIAEFFVKEYEIIEKQLAPDGSMVDADKNDKEAKKRKLKKVIIRRYKLSGDDVLEETTFPGQYIPIVPFHGEEVWDDGKRNLLSLHRQAKDAQRLVNKWSVVEGQILDMAPIAPFMAEFGSIEDFAKEWANPKDNMVLRYKKTNASGEKFDKPERLMPPPIPTGIIQAKEGAKQAVKEALGMYNDNVGEQSNAISGKAINAHKEQGSVATFHFSDNAQKSVEQLYRILVCAAPEVYDTARIIQIIGAEDKPKQVGINGGPRQEGQEHEYDLTKGKYDVRVIPSTSFANKRQETAAILGDIIKQDPESKMIFGDLYFKNLDIAGAEAISERMKKAMPPQLTQGEDGKEQAPDPEKMHMTQLLQAAQQQMQQMSAELQDKNADRALRVKELEIKESEARARAANERLKIATDTDIKMAQIILEAEQLGIDRQKMGIDTTHAEIQMWQNAKSQAQELTADAQGAAG